MAPAPRHISMLHLLLAALLCLLPACNPNSSNAPDGGPDAQGGDRDGDFDPDGDGCDGTCSFPCMLGEICDPDTCRCVPCEPDCEGRECGPDGCGGQCGPGCSLGFVCGENFTCAPGAYGDYVYIPPGEFLMGTYPTDQFGWTTQHQVTLTRGFWMKAHEVTQGELLERMGQTLTRFPDCGSDCPADSLPWYWAAFYCNLLSQEEGLPECFRCIQQGLDIGCELASLWATPYDCPGYRLPTEAEWEYAARAGNPHENYGVTCDEEDNCTPYWEVIGGIAWYEDNSDNTPHPVGLKAPNDFGLYDMLGNVSEWCHESKEVFGSLPVTDPYIPIDGVSCSLRGGEFWCQAGGLAVYNRGASHCGNPSFSTGVRPVRTALPR